MKYETNRTTDKNILLGIGYYAFWRMSGNSKHKEEILKTILPQVVNFMEEKSKDLPVVSFFKNIVSPETRFDFHDPSQKPPWHHLCSKNNPYLLGSDMYSRLLEQFLKDDFFENNAFNPGIYNGLAGLALALLTELDGDESWTSLFRM